MKLRETILLESLGLPRYSGILLLKVDDQLVHRIKNIQAGLPEEAVPIKDKYLHVTLMAHRQLKQYKSQLKETDFSDLPKLRLDFQNKVYVVEKEGRKSWFLVLVNQEEVKKYVKLLLDRLQLNLEPEVDRIYHISIANLTGNPGDSVAYVEI